MSSSKDQFAEMIEIAGRFGYLVRTYRDDETGDHFLCCVFRGRPDYNAITDAIADILFACGQFPGLTCPSPYPDTRDTKPPEEKHHKDTGGKP